MPPPSCQSIGDEELWMERVRERRAGWRAAMDTMYAAAVG